MFILVHLHDCSKANDRGVSMGFDGRITASKLNPKDDRMGGWIDCRQVGLWETS